MAEPPLDVGAVNATESDVLPPVTLVIVGAEAVPGVMLCMFELVLQLLLKSEVFGFDGSAQHERISTWATLLPSAAFPFEELREVMTIGEASAAAVPEVASVRTFQVAALSVE
jgi:hypothetical protein